VDFVKKSGEPTTPRGHLEIEKAPRKIRIRLQKESQDKGAGVFDDPVVAAVENVFETGQASTTMLHAVSAGLFPSARFRSNGTIKDHRPI
jgi:hypothetical protein